MNSKVENQYWRPLENFHIFLWLIKDICWISDVKLLGIFMILPTILVAIFLTYKHRHSMQELAHNIAVCCWISANSIWMIGEFYYNDSLRLYAKIFFVIGIATVGYYYLSIITKHFLRRENNE